MSIFNSNLAKYNSTNVDMTVSVTENAVNSQLCQYLASISTALESSRYSVRVYILSYMDETGIPIQFTVDGNTDDSQLPQGFPEDFYESVHALNEQGSTLYGELDSLNLFDIPSGSKSVIKMGGAAPELEGASLRIQKAAGYYVKYGVYIEDGIPDHVLQKLLDPGFHESPYTLIKPITLQPNTKNVLFRQFFRNICGIQLSSSNTGTYPLLTISTTLSKMEQKNGDIWYFPFQLSLDFRATDYESCGQEIQKKIQQMSMVENPDDVFNISQLCLDLQTLSTSLSPTIQGFDHDVDYFLTNIIRSYFDRLEKAGQTVFGSVITTKPASTQKYLFTPKMRNYHISPRTLDYLIGFGDEMTIPNLGNDLNLAWDGDQDPLLAPDNPNNAAIAISSTHFIPFIKDMVRPALSYLPNKIEVFADDPIWKDQFKVWVTSQPLGGSPDFSQGGTPGNPIFQYSYCSHDETKRHLMWQPPFPSPVASLKLTHEYSANVTGRPGTSQFGDTLLPAFVFDFNIKGWLLVDYNTNTGTKGTYFDRTIRMAIGIEIDSQTGSIGFVKTIETIDNHPKGLPKSGWVEFMSAKNIGNYVNKLVSTLKEIIAGIEQYSIDEFTKSVNSQIGFVMPGSKTFTFIYDKPDGKASAITPNGDLYLFGNYVQELAK